MTFTTVTTGRFGSLHPRLNREACRPALRPHRPSSPHQCLQVRFVQPIVVHESLNRLNHRAISGEMKSLSGTEACDIRSTGIAGDPEFAYGTPHSGPCAALPADEDVPHRTSRRHFPIAAETSPAQKASVSLETSDNSPLCHPRSRASSTVQRRENSRSHTPPKRNGRQSPRICSDIYAHGCAAADPAPLTLSRALAEFSHKFHRRFSLREMFPRLAFGALGSSSTVRNLN